MAREIELTQGMKALVDDEDYKLVSRYKWHANVFKVGWYAVGYVEGKQVLMHRFIIGARQNEIVDHGDGDGLNNRRGNLRVGTQTLNNANSAKRKQRDALSKYKGVTVDSRNGRFQAQIQSLGKVYYLGKFDNENDAAKAYDSKARELFGKFTNLNFPDA